MNKDGDTPTGDAAESWLRQQGDKRSLLEEKTSGDLETEKRIDPLFKYCRQIEQLADNITSGFSHDVQAGDTLIAVDTRYSSLDSVYIGHIEKIALNLEGRNITNISCSPFTGTYLREEYLGGDVSGYEFSLISYDSDDGVNGQSYIYTYKITEAGVALKSFATEPSKKGVDNYRTSNISPGETDVVSIAAVTIRDHLKGIAQIEQPG